MQHMQIFCSFPLKKTKQEVLLLLLPFFFFLIFFGKQVLGHDLFFQNLAPTNTEIS